MRNTLLSRLADRLILCPTRAPIDAEGKTRRVVCWEGGEVEVWTHRANCGADAAPEVYVVKFPGTAGRAERSSDHPADHWPDCGVEIWTVNPPGYGGSTGRASLQKTTPMARAVYGELARQAAGRPVLAVGNSLGCAAALFLAAHVPVAGVLLRNPPPIREVILGEHGWWNLGLGVRLLVRHLPHELDCIRNAAQARAPAVIVTSGRDTLIAPSYQRLITDAYTGEKRVQILPDADHATRMSDDETRQYHHLLRWLRATIGF